MEKLLYIILIGGFLFFMWQGYANKSPSLNILKLVEALPSIVKLILLAVLVFIHFLKTAGWFIPADSFLIFSYAGETVTYVIFSIALLGSLIQRTVPKPRPFWPKLAAIDLALFVGLVIRFIWSNLSN